MGVLLLVMPQMFLAGTIIPLSHSTGALALLAKIMPLTYLTDLARGLLYCGDPAYDLVVLHGPLLNVAVVCAFLLAFLAVGTAMVTRSEGNR